MHGTGRRERMIESRENPPKPLYRLRRRVRGKHRQFGIPARNPSSRLRRLIGTKRFSLASNTVRSFSANRQARRSGRAVRVIADTSARVRNFDNPAPRAVVRLAGAGDSNPLPARHENLPPLPFAYLTPANRQSCCRKARTSHGGRDPAPVSAPASAAQGRETRRRYRSRAPQPLRRIRH